jgi:trehalose-6-phosphatase
MTVTTEERGKLNMFAKEPQMQVMEVSVTHNEFAEKLNGRVAMLGVIAALGAYAITGQIIPGLW